MKIKFYSSNYSSKNKFSFQKDTIFHSDVKELGFNFTVHRLLFGSFLLFDYWVWSGETIVTRETSSDSWRHKFSKKALLSEATVALRHTLIHFSDLWRSTTTESTDQDQFFLLFSVLIGTELSNFSTTGIAMLVKLCFFKFSKTTVL